MMPGMIMLWWGAEETIPSGWHECDGTMGTPDLVNKFVMGAGMFPPPGMTGGIVSHSHDLIADGHSHAIPVGTGLAAGTDYTLETTIDPATGTTNVKTNVPPWHSLFYIMKL